MHLRAVPGRDGEAVAVGGRVEDVVPHGDGRGFLWERAALDFLPVLPPLVAVDLVAAQLIKRSGRVPRPAGGVRGAGQQFIPRHPLGVAEHALLELAPFAGVKHPHKLLAALENLLHLLRPAAGRVLLRELAGKIQAVQAGLLREVQVRERLLRRRKEVHHGRLLAFLEFSDHVRVGLLAAPQFAQRRLRGAQRLGAFEQQPVVGLLAGQEHHAVA